MLKLPFHIESPLAVALLVGAASALFAALWWAYGADRLGVRNLLGSYFQRRWGGAVPPERALAIGGQFLAGMAILFGALALFALAVGVGLVTNGDGPRPRAVAGADALQQYLNREGGSINVKDLVEKNRQR